MAYISQDEKKIVAAQIKPVLAKFGLKGTLSIRHHAKLVLTISSGKIDFITNYNAGVTKNERYSPKTDYIDVNEYHFKYVFTGEALDAITQLYKAMRIPGWRDNSDIQSDYFDVSYYLALNIGTYDKSYRVIK